MQQARRERPGRGDDQTVREWLEALGDIFWIRPALIVLAGVVLGEMAVLAEQAGRKLPGMQTGWIYSGGEAGARALLGAVASSTIGVAGTTFSITVAALSLASGQMGPRLLRNFVRDRGNQMRSASSSAPSPMRSWCCAPSARSRRRRSCRISASPARWSWR